MGNGSNDKKVQVFISFKSEYQETAAAFKKILSRYGGSSLEINLSQKITPGFNWRKWIHESLEQSHLLILLFTAPTASWDWCLYEVGLFRKKERPVICFHNPKFEAPDPLKEFQNVKAEKDSIKNFLRKFYGTTEITGGREPISNYFEENPEELDGVAEEIKDLFVGTAATTQYINHYIKLFVKDRNSIVEGNKIPEGAEVDSNSSSLAIFDLLPGDRTWGDILDVVGQTGDTLWIEELTQAVIQASQKRIPRQITSHFNAPGQDKHYRPVLYRVDYGADDSIRFYILFVIK